MYKGIKVSTGQRGLLHDDYMFIIRIPITFIMNEQFEEVMSGNEVTNTAGWLRALADQIDAITERQKNGN